MNLTLLASGVVILIVVVSIALVVWFSRQAAAVSEKRMMQMLTRAGAHPELSRHDDTWAVLQVARGRCSMCRSEDLCDGWLAGNVEGDNSFCPNARIFRVLKRITKRIAASIYSGRDAQAITVTFGARNVGKTSVEREASIRLTPSINSPISAVL